MFSIDETCTHYCHPYLQQCHACLRGNLIILSCLQMSTVVEWACLLEDRQCVLHPPAHTTHRIPLEDILVVKGELVDSMDFHLGDSIN